MSENNHHQLIDKFVGSAKYLVRFLMTLVLLLTFVIVFQLRISPASNRAYLIEKLEGMILEQSKLEANQAVMTSSLRKQNELLQQVVNIVTASGMGRDLPAKVDDK